MFVMNLNVLSFRLSLKILYPGKVQNVIFKKL